jgi:hypothetical protein
MYLWDVANGYDVRVLAKSDEITKRTHTGEYMISIKDGEYRDYFITFEVEYSSPSLEIKFGGNTNVPWVYISTIKLEEGDVVTQYVSHIDDYVSAYGNSGESFSGDAADVSYAGKVEASNVKDALDLLSDTMITTEPDEGDSEEVTDYDLMMSDVEHIIPRVVEQTDSVATIQPNVLNVWGEVTSLDITLAEPTDNTIVNEYMVQFASGEVATTLILPDTIKWMAAPSIEPNRVYQLSIINNLGVIGAYE